MKTKDRKLTERRPCIRTETQFTEKTLRMGLMDKILKSESGNVTVRSTETT